MDQEKSFLQDLYKALFQAEGSDPKDNQAQNPEAQDQGPRTSSAPLVGEAENRVLDDLTYKSSPKGGPAQTHPKVKGVGAPPQEARPPVGSVCQALPDGPRKLLELLQEVALSILPPGNRDLRRKVGTVVFLLPLEMVALHLGITRQTVWAWKKELEATGLIATDTLYARTKDGQQRALGTLWSVRLRPGKAHLTRDDYLYSWRNMDLDIANGILSYKWVQAHKERGIHPTLDTLVLWAQGKRVIPNTKSVAVDLGLILVLPEVEEAKRPMLITLLATYLSQVFDDHLSRRFYAGLMWSVARCELPAQFVFSLIVRTLRDYKDGLITRPGAYIVRTLKQAMEEPAA